MRSFSWNKVRYRADKPIGELFDMLQKELVNIDNDVKGKFNQYNSIKTNYASLQRKQTYVLHLLPESRLRPTTVLTYLTYHAVATSRPSPLLPSSTPPPWCRTRSISKPI